MVEITIINRIQELNSVYSRFESLKLHPVPIREIRILFKNSKSIIISKNAIILIDGYELCLRRRSARRAPRGTSRSACRGCSTPFP